MSMTQSGIEPANFRLLSHCLIELHHRLAPVFKYSPVNFFFLKIVNKLTKLCQRFESSERCLVFGLSWGKSNENSWNAVLYTVLYRKMEDQFGKSWSHSASLSRRQIHTHHTHTHTRTSAFHASSRTMRTILSCVLVM